MMFVSKMKVIDDAHDPRRHRDTIRKKRKRRFFPPDIKNVLPHPGADGILKALGSLEAGTENAHGKG